MCAKVLELFYVGTQLPIMFLIINLYLSCLRIMSLDPTIILPCTEPTYLGIS